MRRKLEDDALYLILPIRIIVVVVVVFVVFPTKQDGTQAFGTCACAYCLLPAAIA